MTLDPQTKVQKLQMGSIGYKKVNGFKKEFIPWFVKP
jgi:hypothetical protein